MNAIDSTLATGSRASSCVATLRGIYERHKEEIDRALRYKGNETSTHDPERIEDENEIRRCRVFRRIRNGMDPKRACRKDDYSPFRFKQVWFPNGVCKHPKFPRTKWRD